MKFKNIAYQKLLVPILDRFGLALVRKQKFPPDFDSFHRNVINTVAPYTLTSNERLFALIEAVRYVVKYSVEGSFVECGVWRGGSAMAMACSLIHFEDQTRDLYLYDTYSGMSEPTVSDKDINGRSAVDKYRSTLIQVGSSNWCNSSLQDVQQNMQTTNYPPSKIFYIEGKVEDTIPSVVPQKIALLRLDTDWYESTKHELEHLFSLVVPNGVIIFDDYGHWTGARKAIDEYFQDRAVPILLNRVDYTGRIAIKPASLHR